MATSSLAINTGNITTFADDTQNTIDDLNTTVTEIVTKFNGSLETTSGHSHDGTDSPTISSGISGLDVSELALCQFCGVSLYS